MNKERKKEITKEKERKKERKKNKGMIITRENRKERGKK